MTQTLHPGRILLVDDDIQICRAFARLLSRHEITIANGAPEAQRELLRAEFDLVLLDVNLGKGQPTGIDCLRTPEMRRHGGVVCMLTANLSPELLHEALLAGADDYLFKLGDLQLKAEADRLVALGQLPKEKRPSYRTIADPGLLRSLRLEQSQVKVLVGMVEEGYPVDKRLAEVLGFSTGALVKRIARIEEKLGAIDRRQLVRYLTILSGYVHRSQMEWGTGSARAVRSFERTSK